MTLLYEENSAHRLSSPQRGSLGQQPITIAPVKIQVINGLSLGAAKRLYKDELSPVAGLRHDELCAEVHPKELFQIVCPDAVEGLVIDPDTPKILNRAAPTFFYAVQKITNSI
jgi:hypothetical protein